MKKRRQTTSQSESSVSDEASELNKRQLKSKLSEAGVELPATEQSKAFYVKLYRQHIVGKKKNENQAEEPDATMSDADYTPSSASVSVSAEKQPPTTAASSSSRKRGREAGADDNGGGSADNQKQKQKQTAAAAAAAAPTESESEEEQPTPSGYEADSSQATFATEPERKKRKKVARDNIAPVTVTAPAAPAVVANVVVQEQVAVFSSSSAAEQPTIPPNRISYDNFTPRNEFQDARKEEQLRQLETSAPQQRKPDSRSTIHNFSIMQQESAAADMIDVVNRKSLINFVDPNLLGYQQQTPMRPIYQQQQPVTPDSRADSSITTVSQPLTVTNGRSTSSVKTPLTIKPSTVLPSEKSIYLQAILAIVWILLFLSVYLAVFMRNSDPSMPHGLPYCDTEAAGTMLKMTTHTATCQPCPDHGYCASGRLAECEKPYITKNAICVRNEKITTATMKMIEILQRDLSDQAGRHECFHSYKYKGQLVKDVKEMLEKKNLHPKGMFDECFEEVRRLITDRGQNLELAFENVDIEEPITVTTTVEETEQLATTEEKEGTEQADQAEPATTTTSTAPAASSRKTIGTIIYSKNPQIPLTCKAMRKVRDNALYCIGAAVLLVLTLIGNYYKHKKEKERQNIEDLVRMTLTFLREQKEYTIVHLRDELKEKSLEWDNPIDVAKYWPEVEERIRSDGRVSEFAAENDARRWRFDAPVLVKT